MLVWVIFEVFKHTSSCSQAFQALITGISNEEVPPEVCGRMVVPFFHESPPSSAYLDMFLVTSLLCYCLG